MFGVPSSVISLEPLRVPFTIRAVLPEPLSNGFCPLPRSEAVTPLVRRARGLSTTAPVASAKLPLTEVRVSWPQHAKARREEARSGFVNFIS
jgi:hypothetical protein